MLIVTGEKRYQEDFREILKQNEDVFVLGKDLLGLKYRYLIDIMIDSKFLIHRY